MEESLREEALEYHKLPRPGKIAVVPTKPLANQHDLALAYSPGVAAACDAIATEPDRARDLTARGNLVAVVTNGTAVLGLGDIGALAGKPVMEGKGCLFKKFAGIDVFDIEVDELDVDRLVEIIASLEPTFGGINLEDFKAPECFEIERRLRERMRIPVFHDDQHGTAIIVGAAVLNALRLIGKPAEEVKLVTAGAGAAAVACLDLLLSLGLRRENVIVTDRLGIVYRGRTEYMDDYKGAYAVETSMRTLAEAVQGADIFLGLSVGNVLTADMLETMAEQPLIFALANPVPEIDPKLAKATRADAIIATGRSDYVNQVNNVLCFPFIFRGALDVGATAINEAMKLACVHAIADLAMAEGSDIVAAAYANQAQVFGPDYLIPKPFDPRLIVQIAPAVAKAAMDTGVATRPIEDLALYRQKLTEFVFKTGPAMKTIFDRARQDAKRIVYADGEEERVLRAVQSVIDENIAKPILIGRPEVVEMRISRLGLRIRAGEHFELVNPHQDPRYREYWSEYHRIMERRGVTPADAKTALRTNPTIIGAVMVRRDEADGMICGVTGRFQDHLAHIRDILGLRPGVRNPAAMSALISPKGLLFMCDTNVNPDPDAVQVAEMTVLGAEVVRRFGMTPKVALLSHSSFGDADTPSARKMREALALVIERDSELEVEGEMQADAAINPELRGRVFPSSALAGQANLLIAPTLDAAHIAFNLLKEITDSVTIGPILLGTAHSAHIVTPSATVRRIINMTALAVVETQAEERDDS